MLFQPSCNASLVSRGWVGIRGVDIGVEYGDIRLDENQDDIRHGFALCLRAKMPT